MRERSLGRLISLRQTPWPTHCQSASLPHTHTPNVHCFSALGLMDTHPHTPQTTCVRLTQSLQIDRTFCLSDFTHLLSQTFWRMKAVDFWFKHWHIVCAERSTFACLCIMEKESERAGFWTETRSAFYELIIAFRDLGKEVVLESDRRRQWAAETAFFLNWGYYISSIHWALAPALILSEMIELCFCLHVYTHYENQDYSNWSAELCNSSSDCLFNQLQPKRLYIKQTTQQSALSMTTVRFGVTGVLF